MRAALARVVRGLPTVARRSSLALGGKEERAAAAAAVARRAARALPGSALAGRRNRPGVRLGLGRQVGPPRPRHVTIVVPSGSDPAALERCLGALVRHTTGAARLVVVDEARGDADAAGVLERYAGHAGVEVWSDRPEGGPWPRLLESLGGGRDNVLLLSAEVEVERGWKQRLARDADRARSGSTLTLTGPGWAYTEGASRRADLASIGSGSGSGSAVLEGETRRSGERGGAGSRAPGAPGGPSPDRPRALLVSFDRDGAPEGAAPAELPNTHDWLVLTSTGRAVTVRRRAAADGRWEELRRGHLRPPWRPSDLHRGDVRRLVEELLRTWEVELIHLHDLRGHGLDLPVLAAELEVPVVASLEEHRAGRSRWEAVRGAVSTTYPGGAPASAGGREADRWAPAWWWRARAEAVGALEEASATVPAASAGADDIAAAHRRALETARSFRPPGAEPRPGRVRSGGVEVAAFLPGEAGRFPGSTHVRLLSRLWHPSIGHRVSVDLTTPEREASLPDGADLALVQRTGLAPESVEPFLAALDRRGTPLLVELDDDLFAAGRDDPAYGRYLEGLEALLAAAAVVTVSTEPLRRSLVGRARRVTLVPNMLDERAWLSDVARKAPAGPLAGRPARLVYVGGWTHAEDLALLRPVLEHLREELGVDAELFVVGGEPRRPGRSWYRRVEVPPGCREYPSFARWLRSESPRWDVAVAPLIDTPFNRSKSDLKFLEYSAMGLPGVYSDVPAYATCVHDRSALVAENTVEAWGSALARLCADPELRARIAGEAGGYVLSERCVASTLPGYLDLLGESVLEVAEHPARDPSAKRAEGVGAGAERAPGGRAAALR